MVKADQLKISQVVKLMRFEDTVPVKRVAPLTSRMVDSIILSTDLRHSQRSLGALVKVTMYKVGLEGLMRGGELVSGIRASDLHWDDYRKNHEGLLFPRIVNGKVTNASVSPDMLRKSIKADVERFGLNPDRYAMHSLRAGGATDLFNMNVPYHIVKEAGRWKSDVALIYYRGDMEKVQAIGKAFGNLLVSSG
jgi:hypothetical protein